MITKLVIYAFIIGATFGFIVPSAKAWARDLKLKMNWWKWLLVAIWHITFLFCILLNFTFIGEGEVAAGLKLLAVQMFAMLLLGVGLVRILLAGREK
jgi:hypothetical protein